VGYETRNGYVVRTGCKVGEMKPDYPVGRLNRYTCQTCGGHTITIDRDEGVTPFMLLCRATKDCVGHMYSSFYRAVEGVPTYEWRKPTLAEYAAMSPAMRDHIDRGGLDIHPIEQPAQRTGAEP
jgi:hypothetical protein